MAVVENAGINMVGSSNRTDPNANVPNDVGGGDHHHHHLSVKTAPATNHQNPPVLRSTKPPPSADQNFNVNLMAQQQQKMITPQQNAATGQQSANQKPPPQISGGIQQQQHTLAGNGMPDRNHSNNNSHQNINGLDMMRNGSVEDDGVGDGGEGFKREMRDLEEMLSKLNPMAEEFVPPSLAANGHHRLLQPAAGAFGYTANNFVMHTNTGIPNGNPTRRVILLSHQHHFFFIFLIVVCFAEDKMQELKGK